MLSSTILTATFLVPSMSVPSRSLGAFDAGAAGRARELTPGPTLPIVLRMSVGTPRSLSTAPVAAGRSAPLETLVKLADLMDQQRHEQQERQRRPHNPSRRCSDLPEFAQFLDDLDDQPHPEQDMIGPADTGSQKFNEAVGGAGEFSDYGRLSRCMTDPSCRAYLSALRNARRAFRRIHANPPRSSR